VHHAATAITAPDTHHLPAYWQFHDAVARAQLMAWLPHGRHLIVDISGPRGPGAELAALAGHTVLRVIDSGPGRTGPGVTASQRAADAAWTPPRAGGRGADWTPPRAEGRGADWTPPRAKGRGADWTDERGTSEEGRKRVKSGRRRAGQHSERHKRAKVLADCSRLSFLSDGCADDVIAEDRALSTHLAAEQMIGEIARVLRPGGRVLACVDSLVLGMAVLADQHHWAHLVDLPHAEVVLVPWPDGTITRCYGPDQARDLFSGAGLTVNWIRPRTVFSESMVTHVLRRDPASLPKLVRAELAARSDESLGAQLVISAVKLAGDCIAQGDDPLEPPQARCASTVVSRGRRALLAPTGPPQTLADRALAGRALAATGVLGLAADAAGRVGPRVEPALGNVAPAVDASPVGVLVDADERGEHFVSLAAGRVQDRFGAVGLGQGGSRIGRVLRIPRPGQGRGSLALQDGYRPIQLGAHLLKALTGDGYLHWCPRLPSAYAAQPRLG